MIEPEISREVSDAQIRRRQASRAKAMAWALVALVALTFFITIAKTS